MVNINEGLWHRLAEHLELNSQQSDGLRQSALGLVEVDGENFRSSQDSREIAAAAIALSLANGGLSFVDAVDLLALESMGFGDMVWNAVSDLGVQSDWFRARD